MTEAITTAATFQERMYERVKESLGELLTADEARQLVDRAIQDSLFSPVNKKVDPYSNRTVVVPNPFIELVRQEVKPLVTQAINQWIADNPGEVKGVIEQVLQDGIFKACYESLQRNMQAPMFNLQTQLFDVIRKIGGV